MERLVGDRVGDPLQIPQSENIDIKLPIGSAVRNGGANWRELQNLNGSVQLEAKRLRSRTRRIGIEIWKRNQGESAPNPGASKIGKRSQAIRNIGSARPGRVLTDISPTADSAAIGEDGVDITRTPRCKGSPQLISPCRDALSAPCAQGRWLGQRCAGRQHPLRVVLQTQEHAGAAADTYRPTHPSTGVARRSQLAGASP